METAFTFWLLIIGALFVLMALTGTTLQRLPLTTAIIYLAVGVVLGASVLGVLQVDPLDDAALLERVTEIAVLIALFTSGLKLRTPLHEGRWILPLRLAFGAMTLTVARRSSTIASLNQTALAADFSMTITLHSTL